MDVFDRDAPPVLAVDPGDTVVVRSLDASGYLERQHSPGEQRPTMFDEQRGHCLTGPIEVRGAEAGNVPQSTSSRPPRVTGAGPPPVRRTTR
jgi:acetamidase/formamidase